MTNKILLPHPAPQNTVIYFDMDGVLADFDHGKNKILGGDFPELNRPSEELSEDLKKTKEEMWRQVENSPSFFRDLPPLQNGLDIYRALSKYRRVILTASPEFGGLDSPVFQAISSQKLAWCQEHLLLAATSDFICTLSHLKDTYHGHFPGSLHVLIDDRPFNCDAWTKAGGLAIYHDPKNPQVTVQELESAGLDILPEYKPIPARR